MKDEYDRTTKCEHDRTTKDEHDKKIKKTFVKSSKTNQFSSRKPKSSESDSKVKTTFVQPSKTNPFASGISKIDEHHSKVKNTVVQQSRTNQFSSRKTQKKNQSIELTEDEKEFEEAKEAFKNMYNNADNPDYNIKSDPNYKIFDRWANTIKGDTDIEKGLTIKKKNNEPPTIDELKYITKITPYLLAYKIHCNKFSTTEEELNKCYKMYTEIKKLIDEFKDHDIKFFRGDRPNKEIINMVHFPVKKTKKAHSLEKKSRSKSMKKQKERTHSLGGKKRKTLKKRKLK
jgi:hypothetical protein